MLVEATEVGFHVKLRKPGDQFDITEARFSTEWMRRVEVAQSRAETPAAPVEVPETPAAAAAEQFAAAPSQEGAGSATVAVDAPIVKKRRGRKPKVVSE